jgi:hypothetical protein
MIELPDEIINIILEFTNIKCHVCQCKYHINFYKKQSYFYFCSNMCYLTI